MICLRFLERGAGVSTVSKGGGQFKALICGL